MVPSVSQTLNLASKWSDCSLYICNHSNWLIFCPVLFVITDCSDLPWPVNH